MNTEIISSSLNNSSFEKIFKLLDDFEKSFKEGNVGSFDIIYDEIKNYFEARAADGLYIDDADILQDKIKSLITSLKNQMYNTKGQNKSEVQNLTYHMSYLKNSQMED